MGMTKETRAVTIKTLMDSKSGFTKDDQAGLELLPDKTLLAFEALAKGDQMAADKSPADAIIQNKANADAALAAHAHGVNATDQAAAATKMKADKEASDKKAQDDADAADKGGKQKAAEQRALAVKASGLTEEEFEEQEYLKSAPETLRTLFERQKKQDAARKAVLVAGLKAAQSEFTEVELKAETLDRLERMARAHKVGETAADYSARPMPRAAEGEADVFANPPDSYKLAIERRKAAVN